MRYDLEPAEAEQAVQQARAELARAAQAAAEVIADGAETGSALVPVTTGDAVAVKAAMAAKRASLARAQAEVQKAQEAMRVAISEQQHSLQQQMHAMLEALEPMQKQMKMLQEGIWTVNLYLGRDEEIHVITEGEPAPAGTPITVRQQVLRMDEEAMILVDGGLDANRVGEFTEWLRADMAHVDQLLPEPRGIVALTPRGRNAKRYGSDYEAIAMAEANASTYFLIRNGQQVWWMWTEFEVGERLVPRTDEFTAYFRKREMNWDTHEYETVDLEPGSHDWLKAEEAADAKQRHYMRVGMILQGLIDRTTVFHPLPVEGLSVLKADAYREGHIVMRADEENLLTTGREPLRDWQKRLNGMLRPGMRVVGNFGYGWAGARRGRDEDDERRVYPPRASNPQSDVLHTIERVEDGAFVILYERTDKVWKTLRNVPVPDKPGYVYRRRDVLSAPHTRASARLYPQDKWIIPFDLVTVEEMQAYIDDRTERRHYLDIIPLLQTAIALKQAEREEERPFRDALTSALTREAGIDEADAPALVEELTTWWKFGNRWHRPLNGEPEHEAKAVRMIVKEAKRRAKADRSGSEEHALAGLRLMYPDALYIARKADGTYVIYRPQPRKYTLDRQYSDVDGPFPSDVFLTVHEHKGDRPVKTTEWVVASPAAARWRVLYSTPEWDTWNRLAKRGEVVSDPEIDGMLEAGKTAIPEGRTYLGAVAGNDYYDKATHVIVYYSDLRTPAEPPVLPFTENVDAVPGTYKIRVYRRTDGDGYNAREPESAYWHGRDGVPWSTGGGYTLIDSDPAGVSALGADLEHRASLNEPGRVLYNRAWSAARRVEQEWYARWEAEQRARFDDDFGDPDLWEGHLKSLKRPQAPSGVTERLPSILGLLLERGVEIEGRTVGDLCEHLVRLLGSDTAPMADGRLSGHKWDRPIRQSESLHDLVVTEYEDPDDEEPDDDDAEDEPVEDEDDEPSPVDPPSTTVVDQEGREIVGEILDPA